MVLYISSLRALYLVLVWGMMIVSLFSGGKGEAYSFSTALSIPSRSLYMNVGFKVPLIRTPAWTWLKISRVIILGSRQAWASTILGPYLLCCSEMIRQKPVSSPFQDSRKAQ